jgi:hypothetical protein
MPGDDGAGDLDGLAPVHGVSSEPRAKAPGNGFGTVEADLHRLEQAVLRDVRLVQMIEWWQRAVSLIALTASSTTMSAAISSRLEGIRTTCTTSAGE